MYKITREAFMIYRVCSSHFMGVADYEEKYVHRVPLSTRCRTYTDSLSLPLPPRLSAYLSKTIGNRFKGSR
jgi:hypothetical protein